MIKFQEKSYSEYDAMRELYNKLNENNYGDKKFEVISRSYLPGILKGNSVVVEKFTATTKVFGRDRYRMYIRVGAKAKMPDEVRMPKTYYDESIGGLSLNLSGDIGVQPTYVGEEQRNNSEIEQKEFDNNKKKGGKAGLKVSLKATVSKLLGDAIVYNKKERLLVLELDTVYDAAKALTVLPFGLGYKIYLLD